MTYTPEDARAAAAKGAAWMDEHCEGWTLLIDTERLDLEEPAVCVLGQTAHCVTHGDVDSFTYDSYQGALDYARGPYSFDESDEYYAWPIEHGFDVDQGSWETYRQRDEAYAMLTCAWREEIEKRAAVEAK